MNKINNSHFLLLDCVYMYIIDILLYEYKWKEYDCQYSPSAPPIKKRKESNNIKYSKQSQSNKNKK